MSSVLSPPRQGILRNPSPSPAPSPYTPPPSLPGTPHLIPSYCSLSSSSASSSSQSHSSDSDTYFSPSNTPQSVPTTPPHRSSFSGSGTRTPPIHRRDARPSTAGSSTTMPVPAGSRKIRFAPLPDPRREVLITDEGKEFPLAPNPDHDLSILASASGSRPTTPPELALPNSLGIGLSTAALVGAAGSGVAASSTGSANYIFANTLHGIALLGTNPGSSRASSVVSDTPSDNLNSGDREKEMGERTSGEWTVLTPHLSISQLPQANDSACGSSNERQPTVKEKEHKSRWTKSLLKPLFGGSKDSNPNSTNATEEEEDDDDKTLSLSLSRTNSRRSVGSKPSRNESGSCKSKPKSKSKPDDDKDHNSDDDHDDDEEDNHRRTHIPLTRTQSRLPPSSLGSGVVLGRSQSDTQALSRFSSPPSSFGKKAKRKLSTSALLFSSPTSTSLFSSKSKEKLGRSQSLTNSGLGAGLGGGLGADVKVGPGGVRRGQLRMLNGRVYGARRVDPFANVRDQEPEFVEWGFGGMGSVNNAQGVGAGIWSKVQSNQSVSIGSHDAPSWGASSTANSSLRGSSATPTPTGSGESGYLASGGSGRGGAEEDDDGSGMAWVRRRRKEREEKERKEREEKEREMRERGEKVDNPKDEEKETETEKVLEAALVEEPTSVGEPEHVTTAIKLPAPSPLHTHHSLHSQHSQHSHHSHHAHSQSHPHLHHSHQHARTHSRERLHKRNVSATSVHSHRTIVPEPERRDSGDTAKGVPFVSGRVGTVMKLRTDRKEGEGEEVEEEEEEVSPSSSGSAGEEREGEAEGEDVEGGHSRTSTNTSTSTSTSVTGTEDEDEEDDYRDEEAVRRTALGAGVEKISRLKEKAASVASANTVVNTASASASASANSTPTANVASPSGGG